MAALGLSLLVSTALGVLILRASWPRAATPCPWPLVIALGAGVGAGVSSVLVFLWMLAFGPTTTFPLAEAGLLSLIAIAGAVRRGTWASAGPPASDAPAVPVPISLLLPAFLVTLAAAAVAFVTILRQYPHGQWDAWMNWDMRARMFYRGGGAWQAAFSATFPWSHPDYPVLVPTLVARTWLYARTETLLGPALVAGTFTFATVAALATSLAALRGRSQGLLAGMLLLSTPFFILHGTALYADVPLGFFFLAAMIGLALDGRHGTTTSRFAALAGVAAGLAMWTKNEGTLFTVAVGLALVVSGAWGKKRAASYRCLWAFGAGLLPMLVLVVGFKVAFAPPNDLLSTLGVERTWDRLIAPERYVIVIGEYARHVASFGNNGVGSVAWILLAYLLAVGVSRHELRLPWVRAGASIVVLLLAGHFLVFVSMADELSRLLDSSLDRLLLQLWPSALFLFFMVVRTPEESTVVPRLSSHSVDDR